jgi:aminoglycoside phosphotransferase family enzyme/predicted kinase
MDQLGAAEQTDLKSWLCRVEQLRSAPEWSADELPVEMRQTHISVILLGRNHVVKLKKPVDFGFLDYTTLEKRRLACEAEVRLNRRLCPDTYLGCGSINEIDGKVRFDGGIGRIVDYCVWMKRLPDARMLDRLLADGAVTETTVGLIAERLSAFHRVARRGPCVAKWGSPAEIRHNWEENFAQTRPFIGRTIGESAFKEIHDWVNEWLAKTELVERRAAEGKVVDGHGDVRSESVCVMDDAVYIYDCIEFNDRFRCNDVASEVAFLAMDLDYRGRPDLGYYFAEDYQHRADDEDLFTLLPFYRCYRAFVRGKVLSFRLNEEEFGEDERRAASARAGEYFELARRYASPLCGPTVISVGGKSGTGKTTMARAIAGELGLRVISADAVRHALFGADKRPADFGAGVYTAEANRRTYQQMIDEARARLSADRGVVLDATFLRAEDRAAARAMAKESGAEWRFIECGLEPVLARARLAERAQRNDGLSDATWEIYLRQQMDVGDSGAEQGREWLTLDTSGSISSAAHLATDWLRRPASVPG